MSNICPCTLGNSVAGALFNLRNAKKLNQEEQMIAQSSAATVISRRVDTVYSLMKSDSSWGYFVKFRLESGEETELKTSQEDYRCLAESRTMRITWKGDTLIAFDPEQEVL